MTLTITAFADSPDQGSGMARDMRVRWALEEAGLPYAVRLVSFAEMKQPAHLARQPFGQIPSFEDGGLTLFESGAIVLHIALHHAGMLPADASARARGIGWLFAALNTIEPPIVELEQADFLERDEPWHAARVVGMKDRIRMRLDPLARQLGEGEWLDGAFSVGDLMMVMVLRRAEGTGLLEEYPQLCAYRQRGEARPAYQRAFAAQLAVYTAGHRT